MDLRLLPVDVARELWPWVSTEGITRLYAMFNRSIQNLILLSAPSLHPLKITDEFTYLVASLRNIPTYDETLIPRLPHTVIAKQLRSLNPESLLLSFLSIQYDNTWPALAYEPTSHPPNEMSFHPPPLEPTPSLDYYAPALRHLVIRSAQYGPSRTGLAVDMVAVLRRGFALPSMLQTLRLVRSYTIPLNTLVEVLPPTLTCLEVLAGERVEGLKLAAFFKKMPKLEALSLGSVFTTTLDLTDFENSVPSNLTELNLGSFDTFPLSLLRHPSFAQMKMLHNLVILADLQATPEACAEDQHFDLQGGILPPSLLSLELFYSSLSSQPSIASSVRSFPATLTELKLSTMLPLNLGHALVSIPHLTSLHVKKPSLARYMKYGTQESPMPSPETSDPKTVYFDFCCIPRSVKLFKLHGERLPEITASELASLPSSLTKLIIPRISLSVIPRFRELLPMCSMFWELPFLVWHSPDRYLFRDSLIKSFESKLDFLALEVASLSHYGSQGVHFKLLFGKESVNSDPPLPYTPFLETKTLVMQPPTWVVWQSTNPMVAFPVGDLVVSAFPNLTKLVFITPAKTQAKFNSWRIESLPASLTHLESISVDFVCNSPLPTTLKYLSIDSRLEFSFDYRYVMPIREYPVLAYINAPRAKFTIGKSVLEARELAGWTTIAGTLELTNDEIQ